MELTRKVKVDLDVAAVKYEVGDTIRFKLKNGEKVKAKAVRETKEGMLFLTNDCVGSDQQMFSAVFEEHSRNVQSRLRYVDSELRRYIQTKLLPMFPAELQEQMVGMPIRGTTQLDNLRIPTKTEIFGTGGLPFPGMKHCKNRIAFIRRFGDEYWKDYWLQNEEPQFPYFSCVSSSGNMSQSEARDFCGVRLVFCLKNDLENK